MISVNGKPVVFEKFPNGETKVPLLRAIPNPLIRLDWESDADFMRLAFVRSQYDKARLFVPYLPYSRQDRTTGGGTMTLADVAHFINGLAFGEVIVGEAHSSTSLAMLERSRDLPLTNYVLCRAMADLESSDSCVLVFPDEGAAKRYGHMAFDHNIIVCQKERDPETHRVVKLTFDDVDDAAQDPNAQLTIVDDLCSKGGTFMAVADALGRDDLHLVVAHCEPSIVDGPLLRAGSPIRKIYTTDSILKATDLPSTDKVDIMPLSTIISNQSGRAFR